MKHLFRLLALVVTMAMVAAACTGDHAAVAARAGGRPSCG